MIESWSPESENYRPLTWWGRHPLSLAAVLALAGGASMILTAVLGPEVVSHGVFNYPAFFEGFQIWRLFTYPWINVPDVWIALGCFLLWRFGESVERHLGRRTFVRLLLLLWIVAPVTITLLGLFGAKHLLCMGIMQIEFAVFVAFATLYPSALVNMIFVTLEARVLAAILVTINALQWVFARDWANLTVLLASSAAAWAYIRYETGNLTLPRMPAFHKKAARPAPAAPRPQTPAAPKTAGPSVDDILDKISAQGMHSLTAEERQILDEASQNRPGRKK